MTISDLQQLWTVSEVNGGFGWKSLNFLIPGVFNSPLSVFLLKFCNGAGAQIFRKDSPTRWLKKFHDLFLRLVLIPQRDGGTEGQTCRNKTISRSACYACWGQLLFRCCITTDPGIMRKKMKIMRTTFADRAQIMRAFFMLIFTHWISAYLKTLNFSITGF